MTLMLFDCIFFIHVELSFYIFLYCRALFVKFVLLHLDISSLLTIKPVTKNLYFLVPLCIFFFYPQDPVHPTICQLHHSNYVL